MPFSLGFGEAKMTHPPEIDREVAKLIEKGVPVSLVKKEAEEWGLPRGKLVSGIKRSQETNCLNSWINTIRSGTGNF